MRALEAEVKRAHEAFQAGDPVLSETILRELDERAPDDPAILRDIGAAIAVQGRFSAAAHFYERAHYLRPDWDQVAVSTGLLRLAQGAYERGWPLYDRRLAVPEAYHTECPPIPPWRGEPLDGKTIVVWREQGLGDMIMCARFVPLLKAMGARVLVVTLAPLVRLFATALGVETFPREGLRDLPALPDYYTHPFSAPRWLGVTLTSMPNAPYLAGFGTWPSGCIGVQWRGNPNHIRNHWRSLPEAAGRRLIELPRAVSLHPDDTGARDFYDTAQIVAGLDLVITVDTSVAHLAGAMGKPCWVLLPAWGLDWRWMESHTFSPWYPSMRLFRQPAVGDWGSVLDQVTTALTPGP